MKLKNFILLIFISIGMLLFAQNEYTETEKFYFRYGPKFGLNLTADLNNMPEDIGNAFSEQLKGNYQIGGFMQFGKKLYLQPEFHYAIQKIVNEEDVVESYEKIKVPVHIGLKFFDIGLISLHISGGAMYSHNAGEVFAFDKNNLEYQVGAGVDVLGFITTDLRYTLRQGRTIAEQISDFQADGGIINFTVGLKLK